jgi:5-methyltetrahydrofolate--homocysteine methyltransferase
MLAMPKIIEILKSRNPDVTIIVGGAPLNAEIAGQYGADGYAANAKNAVQLAAELMQGK